MNPKLNNIFLRRSVRNYTEQKIDETIIKDILEAAMAAPSAVAKDPWHFIVVREKDALNKMADGLPNAQMLREAAVGIMVCGDIDKAHGQLESYMIQDCSAAIQNILLASGQLGLGACWLGVHPREERIEHIRKLFKLPKNIIPVSAIAIGWPAEKSPARTRYNEELVHREKW